jgi:hypothetical protein
MNRDESAFMLLEALVVNLTLALQIGLKMSIILITF